jgi:hypothetical protein
MTPLSFKNVPGTPMTPGGTLLPLTPHRLQQRQKQIDMGKSTTEYAAYLRSIPKFDPAFSRV